MPYKDPEKARQRARERYQEIKDDPEQLSKRRERQKLAMRKWREKNPERARQLVRESQKRNYNTEEHTEYIREWRKNNPYNYERYKQRNYEQDRQKKIEIIIALGGKCTKCTNSDFRVLCGHHINGRTDVEKNDKGKWYRHPPPLSELMLLCSNCHIIIHSKLNERGLPL